MASRKNAREDMAPPTGTDPYAAIKARLEAGMSDSEFTDRSDDVVGYWNPDLCPIICIPVSAKVFDGNIEKQKPSCLLVVKLVDHCIVNLKREEDQEESETIVAKPGDMVGVWAKPGMKGIRNLCGVEVRMKLSGELDTGKPNPMKTFKVTSRETGTVIPITEDRRDKSAGQRIFLDQAPPPKNISNGPIPISSPKSDTNGFVDDDTGL